MSYLVIADSSDECATRVASQLRERGHHVVSAADVLAASTAFSWELTTRGSRSTVSLESATVRGEDLDGVFVRTLRGLSSSEGWEATDWLYVWAESQSA